MYAPRKTCAKCGSINHHARDCKNVGSPMISPLMPALVDQNFSNITKLPYLPNPYFQYGNINMSSMPWSNSYVNNSFIY